MRDNHKHNRSLKRLTIRIRRLFYFSRKSGRLECFILNLISCGWILVLDCCLNYGWPWDDIIAIVCATTAVWLFYAARSRRCNDLGCNFGWQFMPFFSLVLFFAKDFNRKIKTVFVVASTAAFIISIICMCYYID